MANNGIASRLQLVGVTAGVTISCKVRIMDQNGDEREHFSGTFDDSPAVTLATIKGSALTTPADSDWGEIDVWSATPGAKIKAAYGVAPHANSAPLPVGTSATDAKTYQFGRAPLE
jgi:hypothetical protein